MGLLSARIGSTVYQVESPPLCIVELAQDVVRDVRSNITGSRIEGPAS